MLRLLSALVVLLPFANAATVSFVSATSGNWNDPTNWLSGALNLLPSINDDVVIAATSLGETAYTVTVNVNVTLTGSLQLGSDSIGFNANPTLLVASGIAASYNTLLLQTGGNIQLASNAELWVTTLTITNPNVTISGSGKLYVNGTLVYAQSGGIAIVAVDYIAAGITVSNGATVQITSGGWCSNGSLSLGASGSGGELVISGAWSLGNCVATGNGGTLTFNSTSAQWYAISQTQTVAFLKLDGNAQLNVSGTAVINGIVWVGGNARLVVSAATTVTGDVTVIALGTYNVAVNANLNVSGQLTLGSDATSGVNPTLWVGTGVSVNVHTVTVQSGGNVAVQANAQLWVHTVNFSAASATVSGSGSLNVTGFFYYSKSGGSVQVNATFSLTGSLQVSNGAQVQITGTGWCDASNGGSIALGSSGQGGELEITGAWNHGNCIPTGGGGNLTFNSATTTNYALAQGTYAIAYLKATGSAQIWAVAVVSFNGGVWLAGTARLYVNQTTTVVANVTATANAIIEVEGANLHAAAVQFGSSTTYILHAATAIPPTVVATGEIAFSGTINVLSQVVVDATENVTVATYTGFTGMFTNVDVSVAASASSDAHTSSRRLLSTTYSVSYGPTNAQAYKSGSNGASSLSPSVLLVGLLVSLSALVIKV